MTPTDPKDKLPVFEVQSKTIAFQNARVSGTVDDLILHWTPCDLQSQFDPRTEPASPEQLQALSYSVMADLVFGGADAHDDEESNFADDGPSISHESVQRLRIRQLVSRAKAIRRTESELANENDPVD